MNRFSKRELEETKAQVLMGYPPLSQHWILLLLNEIEALREELATSQDCLAITINSRESNRKKAEKAEKQVAYFISCIEWEVKYGDMSSSQRSVLERILRDIPNE